MPKSETREVLGFQIELTNIPATLAEAVELAGSEEEVRKNHVQYVIFHGHNGQVRPGIVELLEERTGIKRKERKEGEETIIDESDTEYVKRLRRDHAEAITDEIIDEIRTSFSEVDWTPSKRGSGKPAKEYLAVYDQLKAAEKLQVFCDKHGLDSSQEENVLRLAVARKAREIMEAAARAAKESLVA